jgi:AcrR family transcriptional regulator
MAAASVSKIPLKDACVQAAREFIAEHGVEHLSLREVARKLDVSHQAPYRHYPSKDHLLAAVIARCFREFAAYLDQRPPHVDPRDDLASLGARYLAYAKERPLEYRLMFGAPWPEVAEGDALVEDATRAFDILRSVLGRVHGPGKDAKRRIDLDAMFIWSNMHGLATIEQSSAMRHLRLAPGVAKASQAHSFDMISAAMGARASE